LNNCERNHVVSGSVFFLLHLVTVSLQSPQSPLFLSVSNNSKGDRLGYWGIYNIVKELAEIAGIKDAHPHQGRHTVATEMVSRGMDPLLARQITRHKSEKSFERYSKRSLQKQAEAQFLAVLGEA
jgi:integrase/recombinase XerD